jgi:hypothetical protein
MFFIYRVPVAIRNNSPTKSAVSVKAEEPKGIDIHGNTFTDNWLYTTTETKNDPGRTDCLVVDLAKVLPLKCADGTDVCRQAMVPMFQIVGHNKCLTETTSQAGDKASMIELAFYDAAAERLGTWSIMIGALAPGEKFKHSYDVPADVDWSGKAVVVKVREIVDTAKRVGK